MGAAESHGATTDWAVRVPASSANLGPGFDVLGMALSLHAYIGVGEAPVGSQAVDRYHPADIAFRRLGGRGNVWIRSPIPAARGLGFSGAMRVGGAVAALVEADGPAVLESADARSAALQVAIELEGHGDNAAASMVGGVVIAADGHVSEVPIADRIVTADIVVWVPSSVTASTDASRAVLAEKVPRADAVFNIGHVAALVAAFATGDVATLDWATEDRLHQPERLGRLSESREIIHRARRAGADAAWLSGSGPTVAALCARGQTESVAAAIGGSGSVKQLKIDTRGTRVVGHGELPTART